MWGWLKVMWNSLVYSEDVHCKTECKKVNFLIKSFSTFANSSLVAETSNVAIIEHLGEVV